MKEMITKWVFFVIDNEDEVVGRIEPEKCICLRSQY